jgi:hypothetical protein
MHQVILWKHAEFLLEENLKWKLPLPVMKNLFMKFIYEIYLWKFIYEKSGQHEVEWRRWRSSNFYRFCILNRMYNTEWCLTLPDLVIFVQCRLNSPAISGNPKSGPNPTIVSYNASVVKNYNAKGSLVRFWKKNSGHVWLTHAD